MVNAAFDSLGITSNTPFWVLYVILTFLMMYSGLVFQSKTIRTLYNTNQYSQTDAFKFGITMMTISWVLILVWGETVLHWLDITPGLFLVK